MQTQRRSKRDSLVRYLRLINCMTVKQVAYKAKINNTHLKEIEAGTRECSELTARRLSTLFGLAYDWQKLITKVEED